MWWDWGQDWGLGSLTTTDSNKITVIVLCINSSQQGFGDRHNMFFKIAEITFSISNILWRCVICFTFRQLSHKVIISFSQFFNFDFVRWHIFIYSLDFLIFLSISFSSNWTVVFSLSLSSTRCCSCCLTGVRRTGLRFSRAARGTDDDSPLSAPAEASLAGGEDSNSFKLGPRICVNDVSLRWGDDDSGFDLTLRPFFSEGLLRFLSPLLSFFITWLFVMFVCWGPPIDLPIGRLTLIGFWLGVSWVCLLLVGNRLADHSLRHG